MSEDREPSAVPSAVPDDGEAIPPRAREAGDEGGSGRSAPAFEGAAMEAFLAAIVDSSDDVIIGKTLDGVIRSWNPAAERLFGYTAAEAIGQPITLIIPADRLDEERHILDRLARGQRIEHFDTVRVAKDGQLVDISLTVSPIRGDDGRVVGASKIARDIGGRKRSQEQLVASEERFRALADNIAQLAWMADPTGSITWYNARWYEYTGSTLGEDQGWGWRDHHHPDHVDRVVDGYRAAVERGEIWEDTFPLRRHDGTWHWFLSRAVPITDDSGNVRLWFGTNTDISERMEMERALREADQRKDEFLATLAHELRNPLAPIASGVEL
ncbi:MAG TPA: PAS domain S-box protein, partial [Thermoanaerobaculia bacterium]|nr:PAS domain S-box protein [Thermoanaerobaculia bacterium]